MLDSVQGADLSFSIIDWQAWAPGITDRESWGRWARREIAPEKEGCPEVNFVPPLIRRRMSRLSKIALAAAFGCLQGKAVDAVRSVFSSRYGEIDTTLSLLNSLLAREALSPTQFSLSVHNATAGIFSIIAGNRQASTTIASTHGSFCYAILEAASQLRQGDEISTPILIVDADESLPETYREFAAPEAWSYGIAFLIKPCGGGNDIAMRITTTGATGATDEEPGVPPALVFLRWLLSNRQKLSLKCNRLICEFEK